MSGAVDASVCAVMWSSHASVLRKYVSFHLCDAERCKAAACLPGSLRVEERLCSPSYNPATWRSCYSGLLPCVDGGFLGSKAHNEPWFMTRVRLDEIRLIFLGKMWLVCNECGSLFCVCDIICVQGLTFITSNKEVYVLCPFYSHLKNYIKIFS